MAACDVPTLVSEAVCYTCIPPGMQELVNTALLCRIARALDPTMTCDVQTLMSQASCLTCIPPGMQALVNTQLLCNIASAIGGATTPAVTCGAGAPSAVPATGCGVYYDTANNALYIYNGGWVLKA